MNTAVRVIVCLIVFSLGYTTGQGHAPFDYDGNGRVNKADFTAASDKIFKR